MGMRRDVSDEIDGNPIFDVSTVFLIVHYHVFSIDFNRYV